MLDAGEDAAPVTAVEGFVNHSADFNVNPLALDNSVVYSTEQFQDLGLIPDAGEGPIPFGTRESQ